MEVKAEDGTVEEERQRVVRSEAARRAKPEAQREEEDEAHLPYRGTDRSLD
jgi:hypothetical protein